MENQKEFKTKKDKISDAEEVKEILSVVSTEVPTLIKNIFSSLYSADIAQEYGKGVGQLYQQLKEQGLPEDMIREIVMRYASSINIIGDAIKSGTGKQVKIEKHIEEDEEK
ncbi:MAG: hypothetical protein K9W45_02870 [Candidatus Heimdallarchaeum aukensis]|uniref:Uncharacterized protein n=1 Tax=Candidatus Heimdallarchaeum aukensis TaxID=2876573 RepID=A0A9Y1FM17_9ARCH|nr:MAG: hypothetical protein K9W45_02870 [Candidatus Heimdallarchaeum aukensis]